MSDLQSAKGYTDAAVAEISTSGDESNAVNNLEKAAESMRAASIAASVTDPNRSKEDSTMAQQLSAMSAAAQTHMTRSAGRQ
ncbi:unnamed protein product [Vitrella brassicaformis CCMP3155]|uniref:Uncharacterized protein n=1 Tax=Vitrella brassicaformis (strain CCMP3155) TaxID=1169540 RepID=A0A0G4F8F8_VITBC|nr:unnamed protein product [Vitrella brassicaformis CCMP3155]|eukprot:CEM08827.1 unnamed protein product [Vitrella brassicaformis CCMP3155]